MSGWAEGAAADLSLQWGMAPIHSQGALPLLPQFISHLSYFFSTLPGFPMALPGPETIEAEGTAVEVTETGGSQEK